ncbi:Ankyrin repeat family protein [Mycena indigotica]|uniref:Ankyrin repeat family protein n=1 Tax=Mycena indigotica TaxID=2126181 RepID=A0A8H6S112_9AGAR|nr:Ankyrin repeat family protein [Mycena indigotica]KAF7289330.1 Ankyrin repeat family protein [Mycena indigotica]
MVILDTSKLAISIEVRDHWHHQHPEAIQIIDVTARHPQQGQLGAIASLTAWRLVRAHIRDDFLHILDADHQELANVFDKYGQVRPHIIEPVYYNGSGCWGKELNKGSLFYVFGVSVEKRFRGQGIGSWFLDKFLHSDQVQQLDVVTCWPAPMNRHGALWEATRDRQLAFFRKNHFRRIGRTSLFGYSSNEVHPSRRIAVAQDVEQLGADFKAPDNPKLEFPLHTAIYLDTTSQVIDTIQQHYNRDPSSIHVSDWVGATPLHIAAAKPNVFALRKLLSWDMSADLVNTKNAEGETPLGTLRAHMNAARMVADANLSLDWQGYPEDALEAEFLLKRSMGIPVPSTFQQYIGNNRYGCTCGHCGGGWFSPRMRFQLTSACDHHWARFMGLIVEILDKEVFESKQVTELEDFLDPCCRYIPPVFKSSFFKTFYEGYCSVFCLVWQSLTAPDAVLSWDSVRHQSDFPGAPNRMGTNFYFRKGGLVAYVFDAITDRAYEVSALRNGEHDEKHKDNVRWTALPTCANDLDFRLVRSMLGLSRGAKWGPYTRSDFEALGY